MDEKDRNFFLTLDRDVLAIQLLEVAVALIKRIRKYAEENEISLGESHTLNMLLSEAQCLIYEANYAHQHLKSRKLPEPDGFSQKKPSDKDYTEPVFLKS